MIKEEFEAEQSIKFIHSMDELSDWINQFVPYDIAKLLNKKIKNIKQEDEDELYRDGYNEGQEDLANEIRGVLP